MARTRRDSHRTPGAGTALALPRSTPWRFALGGLFLVALLLRIWTLVRLARTPLLEYLVSDSDVYWRWATSIRAGDWIGHHAFFFGPLYPYWLAVVRAATGDSILQVLVVQSILGAISACLLADAARRLTSTIPALVVGLLLAVNRQAIFLDVQILMESLLFALQSLLLWIVVANRLETRERRTAIACGALIGVLALGRATGLALLVPLLGYFAARLTPRRAIRAGVLAGLAAVALALPVTIRNFVVTHEWIPYTYSSGFNLYVGNGPESDGTSVDVIPAQGNGSTGDPEGGPDADGRSYLAATRGLQLSPAASSRWWTRETVRQMREHPGLAGGRVLRKLGLLVNHRELPQVSSAEEYEHFLGPIGVPLAGWFFPIGLLGLAGVPFALRGDARRKFPVAVVVTCAMTIAMFFVTDRYRIHLLPSLAVLAAIGVQEFANAIRSRSGRTLGAFAALFACAAVAMFLPLVPSVADHVAWLSDRTVGNAWLQRGAAAPALAAYDHALRLEAQGRMPGMDSGSARVIRAAQYQNRATALAMLGRHGEAVASLEAALRLGPETPGIRPQLAEQLALAGRTAEAAREFHGVGLSNAAAEKSLLQRAAQADARGDRTVAREALIAAESLVPGDEFAAVPLVRLHLENRSADSAEVVLERARRAGLDANVYLAHAAWIAFVRGNTADAKRIVVSIPPAGLADPRVAGTIELMNRSAAPR